MKKKTTYIFFLVIFTIAVIAGVISSLTWLLCLRIFGIGLAAIVLASFCIGFQISTIVYYGLPGTLKQFILIKSCANFITSENAVQEFLLLKIDFSTLVFYPHVIQNETIFIFKLSSLKNLVCINNVASCIFQSSIAHASKVSS